MNNEKFRVMRYENYDFRYRYLISDKGSVIDLKNEEPVPTFVSNAGYLCAYFTVYNHPKSKQSDGRKAIQLQIHRLVANNFIENVDGKSVHHKDGNRHRNEAINLEVVSASEHAIEFHSKGENNGNAKLTESDVHKICKMLESGEYTHRQIVEAMKNPALTVSSVEKISSGKNWKSISSQYNITKKPRAHMAQFKGNEIIIGCMMYNGIPVKAIMQKLGYDYNNRQERENFKHCAKRYALNYSNGIYGLFTRQEAESICDLTSEICENQQRSLYPWEIKPTTERATNSLLRLNGYDIVKIRCKHGTFDVIMDPEDAEKYLGSMHIKMTKSGPLVKSHKKITLKYAITNTPETVQYDIIHKNGNTLDLRKSNLIVKDRLVI